MIVFLTAHMPSHFIVGFVTAAVYVLRYQHIWFSFLELILIMQMPNCVFILPLVIFSSVTTAGSYTLFRSASSTSASTSCTSAGSSGSIITFSIRYSIFFHFRNQFHFGRYFFGFVRFHGFFAKTSSVTFELIKGFLE